MSYGVLNEYALSGQTVSLRFEGGEARLEPGSYTHRRAHETGRNFVCRLLL